MTPLALYIHWPFCVTKCPYCDFNSYQQDKTPDRREWLQAYQTELQDYAEKTRGRPISSIFFGGGTPSLMQPSLVEGILEQVTKLWTLAPACEITLEANPSSASPDHFKALRALGINRLSIGVQSFDDQVLRWMARPHDAAQAHATIAAAAHLFDRFSFDLIYAYHDQTLPQWQATMRQALGYRPKHLSVYQLTIEPNTAFATRAARGEALTVDSDTAADLYEATQQILGAADLPAYEISNHAAAGQASRHNLAYWRYDDYAGIGPGAHGRLRWNGQRYATVAHRHPDVWLQAVKVHGHGRSHTDVVDTQTAEREALMMGLRLRQGIDLTAWEQKFSRPLIGGLVSQSAVQTLVDQNLLRVTTAHLQPTATGMMTCSAVLDYLLNG